MLLEPWQWVVNHRFFQIFCSITSGSYCCTGQPLGDARFYVMCHGSGLSIIDSFRCFILLFQGLIAAQGSLSVLLEPWQWVVNLRFFQILCFIISGSYCITGQPLGVAGFYVMCHGSGLSIIESFRYFVLLFQGLIAVQGSLSVLLDSMLCAMAVG